MWGKSYLGWLHVCAIQWWQWELGRIKWKITLVCVFISLITLRQSNQRLITKRWPHVIYSHLFIIYKMSADNMRFNNSLHNTSLTAHCSYRVLTPGSHNVWKGNLSVFQGFFKDLKAFFKDFTGVYEWFVRSLVPILFPYIVEFSTLTDHMAMSLFPVCPRSSESPECSCLQGLRDEMCKFTESMMYEGCEKPVRYLLVIISVNLHTNIISWKRGRLLLSFILKDIYQYVFKKSSLTVNRRYNTTNQYKV